MIVFGYISIDKCINMIVFYIYESIDIFVLRIKKNGIIILDWFMYNVKLVLILI